MTDIRSRLAQVDTKQPPDDLWMRATRLAPSLDEQLDPAVHPPRRPHGVATGWRKVAIIVAAFAVFGAAVGFAFIVIDGGSEPKPKPPQPAQTPFAGLPKGWSELATPPEVRCCAATAWTGSELLIWGGHVGQSDESEATGMIYDATQDAWTEMPPSPLGPRSLPGGVWTGRELLVWGGADFNTRYPYEQYSDGAAFDPAAGTWRKLPPAPIDAREPLAVWTGKEMIVWGNQNREDRKVDGAAYDPATNSWRTIADAPTELTDASASWTGQEMIVFGAALHGGNVPESSSAIGAAYDPTSDTWRTIAESDLDTNANDSVWIGDRLLAWDYNLASQTYDPENDRWTDAGAVPTDECEDTPSTVFAGAAYGQLCGDLVTFNDADERWSLLDDPAPTFFARDLFGAGDTFLASGVTGKFGEGDDWAFFAYRSEAPLQTPAGPVTVPDLVGLQISEAIQAAEEAGLMVGTIQVLDDSKLGEPGADDVVAQDPAPGTTVDAGAEISVSVTAIAHRGPSPADPADPSDRDAVRSFTRRFLEARVAGAEERLLGFLSVEGQADWRGGELGPLTDPAFSRTEIVFIDGPLAPDGSYEVGVALERQDGSRQEETLFIGPGHSVIDDGQVPLVVHGARPGLTGP